MEIHFDILLAQALTFLAGAFILWKFCWKRVLAALDERGKSVSDGLEAMERGRGEIAALKAEYEAKLAGIEDFRQCQLASAHEEMRALREQAREAAALEARKLIEQARESVHLEFRKAQQELRDYAVDLAIAAAEHLLKDKVDSRRDRALTADFLDKLEKV